MRLSIKIFVLACFSLLFFIPSLSGADQSSQLLKVFEQYNNCETEVCIRDYLDGVMLKQFSSLKAEKVGKFLKDSKLGSFKSESKFNGENAALFIRDYHYVNRPEVQAGIIMVYLFIKKGGDWKIYHRLNPKKVGADLKPIELSK